MEWGQPDYSESDKLFAALKAWMRRYCLVTGNRDIIEDFAPGYTAWNFKHAQLDAQHKGVGISYDKRSDRIVLKLVRAADGDEMLNYFANVKTYARERSSGWGDD